jgi:hypothetical protein
LGSIYKDQFASNTSEDVAVMLRPLTEALVQHEQDSSMSQVPCGTTGCISSSRCKIAAPCSQQGANLCFFRTKQPNWPQDDPPPGGARRDRTDDLMLAKHALSQLSYGPFHNAQRHRAENSGAARQFLLFAHPAHRRDAKRTDGEE